MQYMVRIEMHHEHSDAYKQLSAAETAQGFSHTLTAEKTGGHRGMPTGVCWMETSNDAYFVLEAAKRAVLPIDPANSVSPASSKCCFGKSRQMLPGVCPGVWMISPGRAAKPTAIPSSALASGGVTSGVATPSQPACISIAPSRPRSRLFKNTGAPVSFLSTAAPPT